MSFISEIVLRKYYWLSLLLQKNSVWWRQVHKVKKKKKYRCTGGLIPFVNIQTPANVAGRIGTAGCGWITRHEPLNKCFRTLFTKYTIHSHEDNSHYHIMVLSLVSVSFMCHNVSSTLCSNTFFAFCTTQLIKIYNLWRLWLQ